MRCEIRFMSHLTRNLTLNPKPSVMSLIAKKHLSTLLRGGPRGLFALARFAISISWTAVTAYFWAWVGTLRGAKRGEGAPAAASA